MYRVRPTVGHPPFTAVDVESGGVHVASPLVVSDFSGCHITPSQFRWRPFSMESLNVPSASVTFLQGLATLAGSGAPDMKAGMAIHIYTCNASMVDQGFTNSDGDMLIVPQQGTLHIRTEFGMLRVAPGHIAVVQRGIVFSVGVDEASRGYICEVYNGHFKLPELGPIGANGLAAPRDFLHPTAEFEDRQCEFQVVQKFIGRFFEYKRTHSPYDVVAWYGNYAPYMYDLSKFCPVGAVQFDHLDPSVFTVLTCATAEPGVATCDFVIFPPRWAVQEHTFRPPYYHRSQKTDTHVARTSTNEVAGLDCSLSFPSSRARRHHVGVHGQHHGPLRGSYEASASSVCGILLLLADRLAFFSPTPLQAKPTGFLPGGASLHSCMASHGPDAQTFESASKGDQKPQRLPDDSLSFMFESTYMFKLTDWALKVATPDADYWKCWEPIKGQFDPNWKPEAKDTDTKMKQ